jgi:hypothetical protein
MIKGLSDNFGDFNDAVKDYLHVITEIEKLSVLEKLSRLGAYLFQLVIIAFFSFLITIFLLSSIVVWFGKTTGSYLGGVFIAGGMLFLIAVLAILFRRKIVRASIINNLSEILFSDDEKMK